MINIPSKESETVEFKSTFNADCIETLAAFANTGGGSVYVGIGDHGEIKGVTVGKESLSQWVNEIKGKTEPSLIPDMTVLDAGGKTVVVIRMIEYPVKPVSVQGRYYKRAGNSNHLMNASEVSDCYLKSMQYSWDAYTRPDTSLEDLDHQRIEKFLNRISGKERIHLQGSAMDRLRKLKLINRHNIPANAAMLLFAKEPLMYDIHAGRLKTPDMILDDRIIRNTLFEAVEETMRYIIGHLKVAYEISAEKVRQTTQRTEIFEYPLDALRELVLNAVIHRKYDSPVDIQIKIYDRKITVFNPGELYGNLTVEDLSRDDYQASARNKLIVEAFFLTGDIEKYGTGFQRIRKAVAGYPTMKFAYRETQGGFLAELSYDVQKESTGNSVEKKSVEKKSVEKKNAGKSAGKGVTESVEKKNVEKKNVEKVIRLIQSQPAITLAGLADGTGLSRRGIEAIIGRLKQQEKIVRKGGRKDGYWLLSTN